MANLLDKTENEFTEEEKQVLSFWVDFKTIVETTLRTSQGKYDLDTVWSSLAEAFIEGEYTEYPAAVNCVAVDYDTLPTETKTGALFLIQLFDFLNSSGDVTAPTGRNLNSTKRTAVVHRLKFYCIRQLEEYAAALEGGYRLDREVPIQFVTLETKGEVDVEEGK